MKNIKICEKYIVKTFIVGPIDTNCYMITHKEKNEAFIVDPGFYSKELLNSVAKEKTKVSLIILTHGHFDHILGVSMFDNIPTYIHEKDKKLLQNYKKNAGYKANITNFEPIKNLTTLKDGDEICFFEDKLKLIHTPGHTKGSCCYEFLNEAIFTGDTIFKNGVGRCDLYGGNDFELKNSINKIKKLEKDYILLPGHGEKTTLFGEKKFNPYF